MEAGGGGDESLSAPLMMGGVDRDGREHEIWNTMLTNAGTEARLRERRLHTESLDYENVQSRVHYGRIHAMAPGSKRFFGYTGTTLSKYMVTLLTGMTIGITAYVIEEVVICIKIKRNSYIEASYQRHGALLHAYAGVVLIGLVLVGLASLLVQLVAPEAAGGGVSHVMAYLNGNHIPNLLRLRTLVVKVVGIMLSCASGMAVGPEGPLVHIGACVASCLAWLPGKSGEGASAISRWWSKWSKRGGGGGGGPELPPGVPASGRVRAAKPRPFFNLYSDTDHREFLSAGAAAGLAAAFGAPIGGVLFSLEEASSYWSPKVTWRCFLCAATASFTLAQMDRSVEPGMLTFTGLSPSPASDWLWQLPFLALLGGLAGCLGAAFNLARTWVQRVRVPKQRHALRVLEALGVMAASLAVMFACSFYAGACMERPKAWEPDPNGNFGWNKHHYGIEFPSARAANGTCGPGTYNDLATMYFSPPQETVKKWFGTGEDPTVEGSVRFTRLSLLIYSTTFLALMSAAAGIAVPSGMFLPSIMVGSSFGLLSGLLLQAGLGAEWRIQPGVYSLVGATAVLGGVFRSSISLVVIIVEGTGGIDYLFGVILAIVMSHWVGHFIHPEGVYETELEQDNGVTFLRREPPRALTLLTAAHIMASPPLGVRQVESVGEVARLLKSTTHNGFPVLGVLGAEGAEGAEGAGGGGLHLEGMILRSQLLVLLQHRVFTAPRAAGGGGAGSSGQAERERFLEEEMRTYHSVHNKHRRHVSSHPDEVDVLDVKALLGQRGGGEEDVMVDEEELGGEGAAGMVLDLSPYMNRAPMTVRMECSAARVHELFLSLGLRHLCVVDKRNHVVGIITRKDLDRYAGSGWWRLNRLPSSHPEALVVEQSSGMLQP